MFSRITSAVDGGFTTAACASRSPVPGEAGGGDVWATACPSLSPLAVITLMTCARGQQGASKACWDYQRPAFLAGGQSAVKMGHSWQQQTESEA